MLWINNKVLFVLELFEERIILTDPACGLIIELDIKVLCFFIDAAVEVLVVVCKLLLFVLFEPLEDLIFSLAFRLLLPCLCFYRLFAPILGNELSAF